MNLCLLFHCVCESYEKIPDYGQDLFVSLTDLQAMIEELSARGYTFGPLDAPGPNNVSVAFDDAYYNNVLFDPIAQSYGIPYLVFVPAYYNLTGEMYPWFTNNGQDYSDVHLFDYYRCNQSNNIVNNGSGGDWATRPMTFKELGDLTRSGLAEIGCHGYYHQPLSKAFEKYRGQEQELGMACIQEQLGITPRYFALANGMYTKRVVGDLLKNFDKVLTIEGRPHQRNDRVVHRLTLLSPQIAGPLLDQIDRQVTRLRRVRRAIRTFTKTHW